MTYKQMSVSSVMIKCLQLNKQTNDILIDNKKSEIINNNTILKTYKHCKQTYNNNNIFLTYKGVIQ